MSKGSVLEPFSGSQEPSISTLHSSEPDGNTDVRVQSGRAATLQSLEDATGDGDVQRICAVLHLVRQQFSGQARKSWQPDTIKRLWACILATMKLTSSPEVQAAACKVVELLVQQCKSCHDGPTESIVEEGAPAKVLQAMELHPESLVVQKAGVKVLLRLSGCLTCRCYHDRATQERLGSKGVIEAVLQAIQLFYRSSAWQHTQSLADGFQCLHFLCLMNKQNVGRLAANNGLQVVKAGMEAAATELTVQENGCMLLAGLACREDASIQEVVESITIIQGVARLQLREKFIEVARAAVWSLARIAAKVLDSSGRQGEAASALPQAEAHPLRQSALVQVWPLMKGESLSIVLEMVTGCQLKDDPLVKHCLDFIAIVGGSMQSDAPQPSGALLHSPEQELQQTMIAAVVEVLKSAVDVRVQAVAMRTLYDLLRPPCSLGPVEDMPTHVHMVVTGMRSAGFGSPSITKETYLVQVYGLKLLGKILPLGSAPEPVPPLSHIVVLPEDMLLALTKIVHYLADCADRINFSTTPLERSPMACSHYFDVGCCKYSCHCSYLHDPISPHDILNATAIAARMLQICEPDGVNSSDDEGFTALHRLALAGLPECVDVFIAQAGPDLDLLRRTRGGSNALQLSRIRRSDCVSPVLETMTEAAAEAAQQALLQELEEEEKAAVIQGAKGKSEKPKAKRKGEEDGGRGAKTVQEVQEEEGAVEDPDVVRRREEAERRRRELEDEYERALEIRRLQIEAERLAQGMACLASPGAEEACVRASELEVHCGHCGCDQQNGRHDEEEQELAPAPEPPCHAEHEGLPPEPQVHTETRGQLPAGASGATEDKEMPSTPGGAVVSPFVLQADVPCLPSQPYLPPSLLPANLKQEPPLTSGEFQNIPVATSTCQPGEITSQAWNQQGGPLDMKSSPSVCHGMPPILEGIPMNTPSTNGISLLRAGLSLQSIETTSSNSGLSTDDPVVAGPSLDPWTGMARCPSESSLAPRRGSASPTAYKLNSMFSPASLGLSSSAPNSDAVLSGQDPGSRPSLHPAFMSHFPASAPLSPQALLSANIAQTSSVSLPLPQPIGGGMHQQVNAGVQASIGADPVVSPSAHSRWARSSPFSASHPQPGWLQASQPIETPIILPTSSESPVSQSWISSGPHSTAQMTRWPLSGLPEGSLRDSPVWSATSPLRTQLQGAGSGSSGMVSWPGSELRSPGPDVEQSPQQLGPALKVLSQPELRSSFTGGTGGSSLSAPRGSPGEALSSFLHASGLPGLSAGPPHEALSTILPPHTVPDPSNAAAAATAAAMAAAAAAMAAAAAGDPTGMLSPADMAALGFPGYQEQAESTMRAADLEEAEALSNVAIQSQGGEGLLEGSLDLLNIPSKHLWLGNLNTRLPRSVLRAVFEQYGPVEDVVTFPGRMYAFVNFRHYEDAARACEALHDKEVPPITGNRRLVVKYRLSKKALGKAGEGLAQGLAEPLLGAQVEDAMKKLRRKLGSNDSDEELSVDDCNGDMDDSDVPEGKPSRHLWLGNIPLKPNKAAMEALFSRFGAVESVRVFPGKTFAFVNYQLASHAIAAKVSLDGQPAPSVTGAKPLVIRFQKDAATASMGGLAGKKPPSRSSSSTNLISMTPSASSTALSRLIDDEGPAEPAVNLSNRLNPNNIHYDRELAGRYKRMTKAEKEALWAQDRAMQQLSHASNAGGLVMSPSSALAGNMLRSQSLYGNALNPQLAAAMAARSALGIGAESMMPRTLSTGALNFLGAGAAGGLSPSMFRVNSFQNMSQSMLGNKTAGVLPQVQQYLQNPLQMAPDPSGLKLDAQTLGALGINAQSHAVQHLLNQQKVLQQHLPSPSKFLSSPSMVVTSSPGGALLDSSLMQGNAYADLANVGMSSLATQTGLPNLISQQGMLGAYNQLGLSGLTGSTSLNQLGGLSMHALGQVNTLGSNLGQTVPPVLNQGSALPTPTSSAAAAIAAAVANAFADVNLTRQHLGSFSEGLTLSDVYTSQGLGVGSSSLNMSGLHSGQLPGSQLGQFQQLQQGQLPAQQLSSAPPQLQQLQAAKLQANPMATGMGTGAGAQGSISKQLLSQFLCPLSQEVMIDPVIAADGYTYNRSSIEQWMQVRNTSPITGQPLASQTLTSNYALRTALAELLTRLQQGGAT